MKSVKGGTPLHSLSREPNARVSEQPQRHKVYRERLRLFMRKEKRLQSNLCLIIALRGLLRAERPNPSFLVRAEGEHTETNTVAQSLERKAMPFYEKRGENPILK